MIYNDDMRQIDHQYLILSQQLLIVNCIHFPQQFFLTRQAISHIQMGNQLEWSKIVIV